MIDKTATSVIVPVFNEEEVISELYERLSVVMESLDESYEIVFVDDGSRDRSFEILQDIHQKDRRVRVVKFSRNFGHHIAVTAGLDYAKGAVVILMDGDLQDPPEEIPKLWGKFKEGYDIVYAIRKASQVPFLKRLFSKWFYALFGIIGNVEIPKQSGIFRIITRRVVGHIKACRERSRFVLALISWVGFSSIGVETERKERHAGKPKYNLLKSTKLAVNAIISSSNFPLHIAAYTGFLIATISFFIGLYILVKKVFWGMALPGYASIIVSIFFLGGIQLILMGVVGEYIGKIYTEVRNRPLYIVEQHLND
ncbi:glycosyltransferase family 2 protein [bacterium]|nr:glycosyltransferase family 2 protein [bacterium]